MIEESHPCEMKPSWGNESHSSLTDSEVHVPQVGFKKWYSNGFRFSYHSPASIWLINDKLCHKACESYFKNKVIWSWPALLKVMVLYSTPVITSYIRFNAN